MDLGKIEEVIRPIIEGSGFRLYDVEFLGRTLRVSIQKSEGAVSLEDCVQTSRILNPLLDVEELIPGSYDLEVSSPGLDRNLRRPEHFKQSMGERIHVTTDTPLAQWNKASAPEDHFFEKRRNVKGELVDFDGNVLRLRDGDREIVIPFQNVTRAYVDFELKVTPKKGKKV